MSLARLIRLHRDGVDDVRAGKAFVKLLLTSSGISNQSIR
jgi:hypothetical protein